MSNEIKKLTDDPWLDSHRGAVDARRRRIAEAERRLTGDGRDLADFASGHEYYGLHRDEQGWIFREWAPNATAIYLLCDSNGWQENVEFALERINVNGDWEITLSPDVLRHESLYRLRIHWAEGAGDRIPAWTRRVVQDSWTNIFNAQAWDPPVKYRWNNDAGIRIDAPLIYEAHVGMAQDREAIGTYCEFRKNILPRILESGYNTVQLMAIMEHPYYGSFGYHVSSFFAPSSRFGTPEELKKLIDEAHGMGLAVIIDLVHSHAARNEVEGLSCFDGTPYQYFHAGERGLHDAWDSRCFDYSKPEVVHFLLSNCRYWLDEFKVDGFRFDGITSMLYFDHGLGSGIGGYADYFDLGRVDADALSYLGLANKLTHRIRPAALTVAEDVSGMVGLGAPLEDGGLGFDYKLAMGLPDFWFDMLKNVRFENWDMENIWGALMNRRLDEKSISYVESHDQSIVGGKTVIFELSGSDMYEHMAVEKQNLAVEHGIALHKMIRLITLFSAGHGYLNFIGNEFGHPEWVDFPREGNNWSYKYARRQWKLRDDPKLKYHYMGDFDREMIMLARDKKLLSRHAPELRYVHCDNQVICFSRGNFFFLFNFNISESYTEYALDLPKGKYSLAFNSDEARFGGLDRINPEQDFPTSEMDGREIARFYLPTRTALALEKIN